MLAMQTREKIEANLLTVCPLETLAFHRDYSRASSHGSGSVAAARRLMTQPWHLRMRDITCHGALVLYLQLLWTAHVALPVVALASAASSFACAKGVQDMVLSRSGARRQMQQAARQH